MAAIRSRMNQFLMTPGSANGSPATRSEVVGLPVTTAARTVVDLARTLEFRVGVVAADSALHQRLVTKADLLAEIADCPRWRGIRRAAEVVEFADGLAESPLESIARVVFRDRGLPAPQLQAWFGAGFEGSVRVDFYWPRYRTVAEVDGALKYRDRCEPGLSYAEIRGCAPRAWRSCTSTGKRSQARQMRSLPR